MKKINDFNFSKIKKRLGEKFKNIKIPKNINFQKINFLKKLNFKLGKSKNLRLGISGIKNNLPVEKLKKFDKFASKIPILSHFKVVVLGGLFLFAIVMLGYGVGIGYAVGKVIYHKHTSSGGTKPNIPSVPPTSKNSQGLSLEPSFNSASISQNSIGFERNYWATLDIKGVNSTQFGDMNESSDWPPQYVDGKDASGGVTGGKETVKVITDTTSDEAKKLISTGYSLSDGGMYRDRFYSTSSKNAAHPNWVNQHARYIMPSSIFTGPKMKGSTLTKYQYYFEPTTDSKNPTGGFMNKYLPRVIGYNDSSKYTTKLNNVFLYYGSQSDPSSDTAMFHQNASIEIPSAQSLHFISNSETLEDISVSKTPGKNGKFGDDDVDKEISYYINLNTPISIKPLVENYSYTISTDGGIKVISINKTYKYLYLVDFYEKKFINKSDNNTVTYAAANPFGLNLYLSDRQLTKDDISGNKDYFLERGISPTSDSILDPVFAVPDKAHDHIQINTEDPDKYNGVGTSTYDIDQAPDAEGQKNAVVGYFDGESKAELQSNSFYGESVNSPFFTYSPDDSWTWKDDSYLEKDNPDHSTDAPAKIYVPYIHFSDKNDFFKDLSVDPNKSIMNSFFIFNSVTNQKLLSFKKGLF